MTSFQKKARVKIGSIPGTRPSLYNNQLLVSTGIPSLDNVIGGGLAVGTLIIVEEDVYGSYAKLMLKYFIAEGIVSQQGVFLCSKQDTPQHLIQELPDPIPILKRDVHETQSKTGENSVKSDDEKMKIAWRYQNQPKVQNSFQAGVQFGHHYDLTKVMNENNIDKTKIFFPIEHSDMKEILQSNAFPLMNMSYCNLLQDIGHAVQDFKIGFQTDKTNILRIGIQSLGSPLWSENGGMKFCGDGYDQSLMQFFLSLRAKLRSTLGVAMITVPSYLFNDHAFKRRIERLSDYVVKLESFAGSDKNPAFKEYHGLLHVVQLPRLNSLVPAQPETKDLAFKLKRKKFTIERLHLPPDIGEAPKKGNDQKSDGKDKLSF